jgi:hypothetical protein
LAQHLQHKGFIEASHLALRLMLDLSLKMRALMDPLVSCLRMRSAIGTELVTSEENYGNSTSDSMGEY